MQQNSMGFTSTLRDASEASATLGDAVYHHADAIQHLAEALEEEVSRYARELAVRITLLHDGAGQISSAGLEIARAGDRIASCGECLARGVQQMVIVIAASMLTIVAGVFGLRYLVLGCMVLWLCGFEIKVLQRGPLPGRQQQSHHQQEQQQQYQGTQHSERPHLTSAMYHPTAPGSSPKRVSWEHGIDGSQGTTDSGVPTPHGDLGQSPRGVDGCGRHQSLDGVYISNNVAPPPPAMVAGNGDGTDSAAALAAGEQAAAEEGVATLRTGDVVTLRSSDGSVTRNNAAGSMPEMLQMSCPADAVGAISMSGGPANAIGAVPTSGGPADAVGAVPTAGGGLIEALTQRLHTAE